MRRAALTMLCLLTAGCTTEAEPSAVSTSAVPTSAVPTSAVSTSAVPGDSFAASAVAGTGSGAEGDPRVVGCVSSESYVTFTRQPNRDDVDAGDVSWPGLRLWAAGDPADYGGGPHYKIGAEVRAGATVTVTIADAAAKFAGLGYGQRWDYQPARSVTFQACTGRDTAFIGGFQVAGRRCVPLDITTPGNPARRLTVSFFAGQCAEQTADWFIFDLGDQAAQGRTGMKARRCGVAVARAGPGVGDCGA